MAIALTGLIIGPLSAGLILGLQTSADTATRISGSADAQALAIALPPDIESAGNLADDVVAMPTVDTECSGVANVLRLRWTASDAGAPTTYQAAYAISGDAATGWRMTRWYCVGSDTPTSHTIAWNLASATAASVAVSGATISLTVTEAKSASTPADYSFTVSGHRRTP
jgi:hypothetical protein